MLNPVSKLFPFLTKKNEIVYLDNAATTLRPYCVLNAITEYYSTYPFSSNNLNLENPLSYQLTTKLNLTREKVARFFKAKSKEINFVPSFSFAVNLLALSLENYLVEGDKILLTHLEHSSNLYPWEYLAKKSKASIIFAPFDSNFSLDLNALDCLVDSKVKIASFFHISNTLGSLNNVKKISRKIKELNSKCLIFLDASQSFPFFSIDVQKIPIDFLGFSAHKSFGPSGIAILWIRERVNWQIPQILWGGGKNYSPLNQITNDLRKFEIGSSCLASVFGLEASLDFLENLLTDKFMLKRDVFFYLRSKLSKLPNIIVYNKRNHSNIILFNLKDFHPHDVVNYLARNNVILRAGNFCCPNLKKIISVTSALRVSLAFYNNKKEIDKLIFLLSELVKKPNLLISGL